MICKNNVDAGVTLPRYNVRDITEQGFWFGGPGLGRGRGNANIPCQWHGPTPHSWGHLSCVLWPTFVSCWAWSDHWSAVVGFRTRAHPNPLPLCYHSYSQICGRVDTLSSHPLFSTNKCRKENRFKLQKLLVLQVVRVFTVN